MCCIHTQCLEISIAKANFDSLKKKNVACSPYSMLSCECAYVIIGEFLLHFHFQFGMYIVNEVTNDQRTNNKTKGWTFTKKMNCLLNY